MFYKYNKSSLYLKKPNFMKRFFAVFVPMLLFAAFSLAQEADIPGVIVRTAGDDGVAAYRIPGLVTSNAGTLVACYDIRHNNSLDLQEDIDIGVSRSTDGGKTWGPMIVAMDMGCYGGRPQGENGVGDPAILVDKETGRIFIVAAWTHGLPQKSVAWFKVGKGLEPEETAQIMLTYSDDDGLTWSQPRSITKMVKNPEWYFTFQSPGRGIQMADGTLVFAAQYQDEVDRTPHSTIMYSKDHGETWTMGTGAEANTTEAQVAEIGPGMLMLNMRNDRKTGRVVKLTWDMGKTWQSHSTSEKIVEPVCMASLLMVPAAENVLGRDILLFSNPAHPTKRVNMTIKASLDYGRTWKPENSILLDKGECWGYSCLTMIDRETVGILYESSRAHMYFQAVKLTDIVTPYHRDLNTIAVNAQTQRHEFFFYDSEAEAIKGLTDGPSWQNPYYINLNDTWDFKYYKDGRDIPADVTKIKDWNRIHVPGNWEVQGYGYPVYTNVPYDFAPANPQPPILPDAIEAGVYHRTFKVPKEWDGKNIYLTLAGASAGVYVYVNGRFAGYCEDSKAAQRYDIAKYLRDGENDLIIKIFRWSTGSYLECQDFWRISGIERDVYLTCEDKAIGHFFSVNVVSTLGPGLKDGIFKLQNMYAATESKLLDTDGTVVASGKGSFSAIVPNVKKWSAETPNLYTLVLKIGDKYTAMDVGFRRFEITKITGEDGREYPVFLVNGQPVKFKGVNYHEHNPLTGHYVNKDLILKDLLLMKSMNINAIRTCHYPQPREFYELCDRLGFYVYDEANIESHGMGYRLDRTLGNNPDWLLKHKDRIKNMYYRTKNYPCVTILSLGNEAGNGVNFYDCYRWLKAEESVGMNRPVCYERAEREWNTDMLVPQYPGADWFKQMGEEIPDRPIAPSEYAHAMGNSTGSLDWQWEQIYKYPNLQGAFIWDWVDQGLAETDAAGRRYFTYGGDYGKNMPSDGNFLCNGIVNPDRDPHPAAAEVKWNYQNVKVLADDAAAGRFTVLNRFYFISLAGYKLEWAIEEDGIRKSSGSLALSAGAQQKEGIGIKIPALKADRDAWVKFAVKDATGAVVAQDAYQLAKANRAAYKYDYAKAWIADDGEKITLSAGNALLVFDKAKGYVTSYTYSGKELINSDFGLRPNFWRAPTDNDYGNGWPYRTQRWKKASNEFDAKPELIDSDGVPTLKVVYSLPEGGTYTVLYTLDTKGVLKVDASLSSSGIKDVELPRYGFRMRIASDGRFSYFGRGPEENYCDRFQGTLPGIYSSKAKDEIYPYVRPQETGHHTGARWLELAKAFCVAGNDFEFNVLSCSIEDLDSEESSADYMWTNRTPDEGHDPAKARNIYRKHQHINDIPVRDYVEVCIDGGMSGVGGYDSWGSRTEPERCLWSDKDYSFSFSIVPDSSPAKKVVKSHTF